MEPGDAVSFNDESVVRVRRPVASRSSWSPVGLVLSSGLARTERGANSALFIIAILMVALSIFLYVHASIAPVVHTAAQDAELHAMGAIGY